MRTLALLPILILAGCQYTAPTPPWFEIGDIHRAASTESRSAQLWFDRGLALSYGFNHEVAVHCFEQAISADPSFAMAHWGKAYALGPNYNRAAISPEAHAQAYASVQAALALKDGLRPAELALVQALAKRYPAELPADTKPLHRNYAQAMRQVRHDFPDDADIAALSAEALMMLRPWKLWSKDGQPAPETPEIRALLERSLARWPNHAALCHLYIHTMEAGPEHARALPAARRLEKLAPGLGHLVHMPSHIYAWNGLYDDMIRVNQAAVRADELVAGEFGRANFYTIYRLHNYHFIAYGAMFTGQRAVALNAARAIPAQIPDALMQRVPQVLDIFVATPLHVMVRFGMWEEILSEPEPAAELFAARAVWHYARGIALAVTGRVEEAARERHAFLLAKVAVPKDRVLFNNPVSEILAVADKVQEGEIAYHRGDFDLAFTRLREAVQLDLDLNYDEPWGWMEPARHALGALLTAQGRYAEAIPVFEANLARFPNNGWALHGLAECLRAKGQEAAAAGVDARFEKAWSKADTIIPGACYCAAEGS